MNVILVNRVLSAAGGPRARTIMVTLCCLGLLRRRRPWSAFMLVAATTGMGALNTTVKKVTRRARPEGLPGLRQPSDYSFPSGHSSGSVVFYGAVAVLAGRANRHHSVAAALLGAAGIIAGCIAWSRVVLRAHHRTDVVAGYLLGAAWLGLVTRVFNRPVTREWN